MKIQFVGFLVISFVLTSCALARPLNPIEVTLPTITSLPLPEEVVLDFALSPDGSKIAVFLNTGIYIYSTKTLDETKFQEFYSNDFSRLLSGAIAFSPDGKNIAISGKFADEHINIWDLETGKFIALISALPNGHFVTEIEFSPDGNSIFVRSTYPVSMLRCEYAEDSIALLVMNNSKRISFTKSFEKYWCNYVPAQTHFTNKNEMYLVTKSLGLEYWVDIIDTQTGGIIQSREYKYEEGEFHDISPNGAVIAIMQGQNNQITTNVIETKTGKILETVPYTVKFVKDENIFLVRDSDGQWSTWKNGNTVCKYDGFSQYYPYWKISADGNFFAVTTPEKKIKIWKVSNCESINVLSFSK
jgi:WD40 repeat protein